MDSARILQAFEQGQLSTPQALLEAYGAFLDPFLLGLECLEIDPLAISFLEAGDAAYRQSLGDEPPPRHYNSVLRMIGLGVTTRSRARRQAEVSPDTPPDPGSERGRRALLSPPPDQGQEGAHPPPPNQVWRPWDSPSQTTAEERQTVSTQQEDRQLAPPTPEDRQPTSPTPEDRQPASPTPEDRQPASPSPEDDRPASPPPEDDRSASPPPEDDRSALPTLEIMATSHRYIKNFKTTFREENMQLNGVTRDILNQSQMESLIQTILDRQIEAVQAAPHDLCIVELSSTEHTERPVFIKIRRVDQVAPDVILQKLISTLNSNQAFLVNGQLIVTFIHIPTPKPAGRRRGAPCGSVQAWLDQHNKSDRKVIYSPSNTGDSMCLTRCVHVAQMKGVLHRHTIREHMRPGSATTTAAALELCQSADLDPQMPCGLDEVKKLQAVCHTTRICVFTDRRGKELFYAGPPPSETEPRKNVYLFLHEGHYHAILKPKAAFNFNYYCERCLVGYDHHAEHRCKHSCRRCGGPEEHAVPPGSTYIDCVRCNRFFATPACFEFHLEEGNRKANCDVLKFCKECNCSYRTDSRGKRKRSAHVCNSFYCKYCREVVRDDSASGFPHRCYILPYEEKELNEKEITYLRCYVDCETTQYHELEGNHTWKEHRVNYLVCQIVCRHCEEEKGDDVTCALHGDRTRIFHSLDNPEARPVSDFLDFLQSLSTNKMHFTIWSHNGSGFDHLLYAREMALRKMIPNMICKGLRILSMSYGNWVFKDSYLFLGSKLSKLPASFGIEDESKGTFPFLFSHPENYAYRGPLPALEYYSLGTMSTKEALSFKEWHAQQVAEGAIFDFREAIRDYTVSDVRILRLSVEIFRRDFMREAGFDAMFDCITLSSAVFSTFRSNFMPHKSMGIVPRPGYYRGLDMQSLKAMRWLRYENSLLPPGLSIRQAQNGREVRILGKFKVDGYLEQGNVVYDFLGCHWHGHPTDQCLTYRHVATPLNKAEEERKSRYYKTMRIHDLLRKQGVTLKIKWECAFDFEMKHHPAVIAYFEQNPFKNPPFINERDGLYGGRSETFIQYYKCDLEKGEKILYTDYQSLYPAVLLTKTYIIGHPTVYVGNDPSCPPLEKVEGYIFCKIVPPRSLLIPILPWRAPSKRLLFTLCRTCGEEQSRVRCSHSDEERSLTGVWPVPEVRLALENYYNITEVF